MRALLTIDAGELDDEQEELYSLADLVHIACGGHAGDDTSMGRVVGFCERAGTRIGAHPSYADREGFGRRTLALSTEAVGIEVAGQIARLVAIATARGAQVTSVKLHGALYHDANARPELAAACMSAVARTLSGRRVSLVGPAHGALSAAANRADLLYLREAFADRATRADGTLVPRSEPGALVTNPIVAAERARALAERGDVEAISIHADTPGALEVARAVRSALGARS